MQVIGPSKIASKKLLTPGRLRNLCEKRTDFHFASQHCLGGRDAPSAFCNFFRVVLNFIMKVRLSLKISFVCI